MAHHAFGEQAQTFALFCGDKVFKRPWMWQLSRYEFLQIHLS
jgi:hypothetical protein